MRQPSPQGHQSTCSDSPSSLCYCTVEELATRLRRNKFTIYHQLTEAPEKLPRFTRLAGRVFFLERDVQAFMANPPIIESRRGRWARASGSARQAMSGAVAPVEAAAAMKPGRGRPTKAAQAAKARAAEAAASTTGGAA